MIDSTKLVRRIQYFIYQAVHSARLLTPSSLADEVDAVDCHLFATALGWILWRFFPIHMRLLISGTISGTIQNLQIDAAVATHADGATQEMIVDGFFLATEREHRDYTRNV